MKSSRFSDGYAHPFFKGLVDLTAQSGFQMKEVSADKVYLGDIEHARHVAARAISYLPFNQTRCRTHEVTTSRSRNCGLESITSTP